MKTGCKSEPAAVFQGEQLPEEMESPAAVCSTLRLVPAQRGQKKNDQNKEDVL